MYPIMIVKKHLRVLDFRIPRKKEMLDVGQESCRQTETKKPFLINNYNI